MDKSMEQTSVNVNCISRANFKGTDIASPGRTLSSDMKLVPKVGNMEISVTDRNYKGLNFHMKMSDRNLAVIRRRAEKLRQKDAEIRERVEKLRQKAKMIINASPAKQDMKSRHEEHGKSEFQAGTERCKKQSQKVSINFSPSECTVSSTERVESELEHETGSSDQPNHTKYFDTENAFSVSCMTSHGAQFNHRKECDIVTADNILEKETGNDGRGYLCDTVSTDNNMKNESRCEREQRPAKRPGQLIGTSTKDKKNPGRKSLGTQNTDELVKQKQVGIHEVKLKSFVGERYSFNKATVFSKYSNCSSTNVSILTPKRNTEMASPGSLGVSPMRIAICKSAKTRMLSTLTTPFTPNVYLSKLKIRKRFLSALRNDQHTSHVF